MNFIVFIATFCVLGIAGYVCDRWAARVSIEKKDDKTEARLLKASATLWICSFVCLAVFFATQSSAS